MVSVILYPLRNNLKSLFSRKQIFVSSYQVLLRNLSESTLDTDKTTHFGYETVLERDKPQKVKDVFSSVASKYDLMNDAMSFGIHRVWKDQFMSTLNPRPGMKLLDVAGGTGDIAFKFMKFVENLESGTDDSPNLLSENDPIYVGETDQCETLNSQTHVTVCDINQDMLNYGKERESARRYFKNLSWVCADAQKLPFDDNHFDAYTIAFGIRNTVHYDMVLSEAYRVLKPGGRFLCLEFSQVKNFALKTLYDAYSFQMIPVLGQILARDWHSYQYLVESIRQFPSQDEFKDLIENSGFKAVDYRNMSSGIVAIHSGFKI